MQDNTKFIKTRVAARYQTEVIMPGARLDGCKCPYSEKMYREGRFMHDKGCPAPHIECLPNPARLIEALRIGA